MTSFFAGPLQQHSMGTGVVANAIAKLQNLSKKECDVSLVGGLLHDAGIGVGAYRLLAQALADSSKGL